VTQAKSLIIEDVCSSRLLINICRYGKANGLLGAHHLSGILAEQNRIGSQQFSMIRSVQVGAQHSSCCYEVQIQGLNTSLQHCSMHGEGGSDICIVQHWQQGMDDFDGCMLHTVHVSVLRPPCGTSGMHAAERVRTSTTNANQMF
jgi:hypothetical protein